MVKWFRRGGEKSAPPTREETEKMADALIGAIKQTGGKMNPQLLKEFRGLPKGFQAYVLAGLQGPDFMQARLELAGRAPKGKAVLGQQSKQPRERKGLFSRFRRRPK